MTGQLDISGAGMKESCLVLFNGLKELPTKLLLLAAINKDF